MGHLHPTPSSVPGEFTLVIPSNFFFGPICRTPGQSVALRFTCCSNALQKLFELDAAFCLALVQVSPGSALRADSSRNLIAPGQEKTLRQAPEGSMRFVASHGYAVLRDGLNPESP
jgi:hypothetical protein